MNGLIWHTMHRSILILIIYMCALISVQQIYGQNEVKEQPRTSDECQVTPVIHVLQYPGCVPKPIPSFACIGRCSSYLQVSGGNSRLEFFFFKKIYSLRMNRFRVVKFGKWSVRACAVKSLVNVKRLFHSFVQKQSQANENSERYAPRIHIFPFC